MLRGGLILIFLTSKDSLQVTSNDVSSLADEGEAAKPTVKEALKVSNNYQKPP